MCCVCCRSSTGAYDESHKSNINTQQKEVKVEQKKITRKKMRILFSPFSFSVIPLFPFPLFLYIGAIIKLSAETVAVATAKKRGSLVKCWLSLKWPTSSDQSPEKVKGKSCRWFSYHDSATGGCRINFCYHSPPLLSPSIFFGFCFSWQTHSEKERWSLIKSWRSASERRQAVSQLFATVANKNWKGKKLDKQTNKQNG